MKYAARMLVSLLVGNLCLSNSALAAKCGTVKNISGDDCSNLLFELDLSGCEEPAPSVKPKVVCKNGTATATALTSQNTYVAKFKQGSERWGVRPWVAAGDVAQIPIPKKKPVAVARPVTKPVARVALKPVEFKPEVKVEAKAESKPEVHAEAPVAAGRAPASEGAAVTIARIDPPPAPTAAAPAPSAPNIDPATKIRGFVDAQVKYIRDDSFGSGAVINDGAIYFSHSKDDAELYIDIPFAWERLSKPTNDIDGDSAGNAFILGRNKPQAYVAYTHGNTKGQIGQFDTIYGFEVNDGQDIALSSQGLIFNRVLALTHTGFLLTQTMGSFILKGLAANAMNEGGQTNRNGEYGAQLTYSSETLRGGAGFLMGTKLGPTGVFDNRIFTDFLAGATFGNLAIDMEYSLVKEPGLDQGSAFLIMPVYGITKELSAALRYEYLDNILDPIALVLAKTWQLTAGVQYQVTDALRLKLDFSFSSNKIDGVDPVEGRAGALAAVYKF